MRIISLVIISVLVFSCKKDEKDHQDIVSLETMAFCSFADPNSYGEIYTSKSDGTELTRVSSYSGNGNLDLDFNPIWSPDGTKILFYSYRDNYRQNIYVYDLISKSEYRVGDVSNLSMISNAEWSRDSKKIIYQGESLSTFESHIFIVNADGSGLFQVTQNGFSYSEPHWHPIKNEVFCFKQYGVRQLVKLNASTGEEIGLIALDGEHICFFKDGTKFAFRHLTNDGISILNDDFTNLKHLTSDGGDFPCLSYDQLRIAYLIPDGSSNFSIAAINSTTGATKINLTNTFGGSQTFSSARKFFPSWSKSNFVFVANSLGQISSMKDALTAENKTTGFLNATDFPQIKP